MAEKLTPPPSAGGRLQRSGRSDERRLATGAMAQQGTQVLGSLIMIATVTAVGRTLTLTAFGLYGLLASLSGYLLVVQTSVEGAAVTRIAAADQRVDRDRAFSTALALYMLVGLVVGALTVGVGLPLLSLLHVSAELHGQLRLGVAALAVIMAVGWPVKGFQDVLRADQRFVAAAASEAAAYVVYGSTVAVLLAVSAPLWTLIAAAASLPALVGVAALAWSVRSGLGHRFRPRLVTRAGIRELVTLGSSLLALGVADLVVYALDRVVLAAFRPPAVIGLYEAPVRAHNLLRQLNGTLSTTVLPAAARYAGAGDAVRLRELVVRGTRYVAGAVVPVTVVLIVLAEPVLRVWLGPRFTHADLALALLVSYWLVASSSTVAGPALVAVGRARALVVYAWTMAVANLGLSLALTPSLGLEGVVLGTVIPYLLLAPVVLILAVRALPVSWGDLGRHVWLPVGSCAVGLTLVLVLARLTLPVDHPLVLLGVTLGGLTLYATAFWVLWATAGERALARRALAAVRPRRAGAS